MSSKAFIGLLAAAVMTGGLVGSAVYLVSGDDNSSIVAQAQPSPSSGDTENPTLAGSDRTSQTLSVAEEGSTNGNLSSAARATNGDAQSGGASGRAGVRENISGILRSISASGITLATDAGEIDLDIPEDTRVRLTRTAANATEYVSVGDDAVAILNRSSDGTLTATNLVIRDPEAKPAGSEGEGRRAGGRGARRGAGAEGEGRRGGGRRAGRGEMGGRQETSSSDFNAVPGTVSSLETNLLTLVTAAGPVTVSLTDDTPIQLTTPFKNAINVLEIGEDLTVIGRRTDDGTYTPSTITNRDDSRERTSRSDRADRRRERDSGGG